MADDLNSRQIRQVYLITLSRASPDVCREGFATKVVRAFEISTTARVVQWVCSREFHADGGVHYHMAVKLDKNQRWLRVRNHLSFNHGLQVNFSGIHHNYYSAWKYVTKTDPCYLQSTGHPDLSTSLAPATDAASRTVRIASEASQGEPSRPTSQNVDVATDQEGQASGRKRKRSPSLTAFDVSQLVVQKNLKTRLELVAYADRQRQEGKSDLLRFIVNKGKRVVQEVLQVNMNVSLHAFVFVDIHVFFHSCFIPAVGVTSHCTKGIGSQRGFFSPLQCVPMGKFPCVRPYE